MSDLEGEDMLILQRFQKRPAVDSVEDRRERETRPLPAADRRLINRRDKEPAPKRLQLNLKVLPEFYERVSALALNERVAMITVIERAVEAYARAKEGRKCHARAVWMRGDTPGVRQYLACSPVRL